MSPNNADGMANSVDPDQTAPLGSLIWVCTVCSDLSVRKLRIITVVVIAKSVVPAQSDLGLHCLDRPVCPKT